MNGSSLEIKTLNPNPLSLHLKAQYKLGMIYKQGKAPMKIQRHNTIYKKSEN